MTEPAVERYLRLGLRVGRHVDRIVDAYVGPPELAAEVEAEPLAEPATLVAEAEALLAVLDDGWLRDQVRGLRTFTGVLAGEGRSYADEVEGCYGVRPSHADEEVFAAAHARLDELLPGPGSLAERHRRWEEAMRVPAERVVPALAAAIAAARDWTNQALGLPAGERVELETVHDVPWLAFCEYQGDLRSVISVNLDLPLSALELLVLAIHETYPGHHAERCSKEHLLVRGAGRLEETLVLVPTPQSLVSEGIATVAPALVLGGEAGPSLAAALRDAGVDIDLAHALAVRDALEPCRWAEVNAALLLHEDGADEADVRGYLERWGLLAPELAAHLLRFFRDPASRTYVVTYPAGGALCRAFVGDDVERFRRLLTEQVRVGDLLAARGVPAGVAGRVVGLSPDARAVGDPGFEPGTSALSERRSNRLS